MIWEDWLQFGILVGIIIWAIFRVRKVNARQKEVEAKWQKFIHDRRELYKKLADPEQIQKDMEASADLREMRDANRTTLPHEQAGPPAVVHRPPLRGKKPGNWRPRNPGGRSQN